MTNLQELDLSQNNLPRVPDALYSLLNLRRLNLSDNQITELSTAIELWTKLETLNICRNKLSAIPASLCKIVTLRRLYLNDNQLDFEGIPSGIGKLSSLQVFSAANNRLEMIPMVPHIQSYAWQCTDCKTCAQCHDPADEDKMLFCDMCDRGYHIYCVGLRRVPQGRWHCQECAVCVNCGSREPGGINSDRNSVAQWQHEYKKGDKNTRVLCFYAVRSMLEVAWRPRECH